MTVDELLGRISSREIADWAAFFTLEREEQDRQSKQRGSQSEDKRDTLGAADAITKARREQGLE